MTDQKSTGSEFVLNIRGPIRTSDAHVPQVVIAEIINAPRLKGVTTPDFVEFKDKREIYERRIAGNDPGPQALSSLQSYRDSIPRHLLSFLVQSGMVKATKPEGITEEDLKNCFARNAIFDVEKHGLNAVEQQLANLDAIEVVTIGTLKLRVTDLCVRYLSTLEKWGCDNLVNQAPDAAINHIMNRIPLSLRARVPKCIKNGRKHVMAKTFSSFLEELLAVAHQIDVEKTTKHAP